MTSFKKQNKLNLILQEQSLTTLTEYADEIKKDVFSLTFLLIRLLKSSGKII